MFTHKITYTEKSAHHIPVNGYLLGKKKCFLYLYSCLNKAGLPLSHRKEFIIPVVLVYSFLPFDRQDNKLMSQVGLVRDLSASFSKWISLAYNEAC